MGQLGSGKQRLGAALVGALALGSIQAAHAATTTYTYDSLGRVLTVIQANGVQTVYTYDPAGNRSSQIINLTLPIVGPVSLTVDQNSSDNPVSLDIRGAPAISVTVSGGASHGSTTASGTSITYTPETDYFGSDSFKYLAVGSGGPSPRAAAVTITVRQIPPIAGNITQIIAVNSVNNPINTPIKPVLSGGAATSLGLVSNPVHGSVSANGLLLTYSPTPGYTGSDQFQYNASNGAGTSNPANVNLTVKAGIGIWRHFQWGFGLW